MRRRPLHALGRAALALALGAAGLPALGGLTGCASTSGATDEAEDADADDATGGGRSAQRGRGEASVSVRYESTAKGNFERGEQEYADENYLAAQKYFQYIRAKFPYSAYATRAELRAGDCLYQRGRFLEAIDAYQNFVRLHATHEKVPYATLMTAKAHVEQIPSDWFLLPPSHEKDQAAVREAANALSAYVARYPSHDGIEEGRKLLGDVRRRLMDHERYVADFYATLEKPRARAGRLEVIRRDFADVGLDDALLLELAKAWADAGAPEEAASAAAELERSFPDSPRRAAATAAVARARRIAAEKAKAEGAAAPAPPAAPEGAEAPDATPTPDPEADPEPKAAPTPDGEPSPEPASDPEADSDPADEPPTEPDAAP